MKTVQTRPLTTLKQRATRFGLGLGLAATLALGAALPALAAPGVTAAGPVSAQAAYPGPVIDGQAGTFRITASAGEAVVLRSPTPGLESAQLTFSTDFSGLITFAERTESATATARPFLFGALGALPLLGLSALSADAPPSGIVDRYLTVDRDGAPSSVVAKAVFQFRAPSAYSSVALQGNDGGVWRMLPTAAKAVDGAQTVYTATSSGLYDTYAITYSSGTLPGLPSTGLGGGSGGGVGAGPWWIVPILVLVTGLGLGIRRRVRG